MMSLPSPAVLSEWWGLGEMWTEFSSVPFSRTYEVRLLIDMSSREVMILLVINPGPLPGVLTKKW